MRHSWHLLLPTLLAAPSAFADSMVEIRDPLYAARPGAAQTTPIRDEIRAIVYPTLGMPALVQPGYDLEVLVRSSCAVDLSRLQGTLHLVGAPAQVLIPLYAADQVENDPQPGITRLAFTVPAGLGADSYDLHVWDGRCVDDGQASSVRIFRDDTDYRFVILTDEQLGDPRADGSVGLLNGGIFPSRGKVGQQERLFQQVQEELEFLDPLFVLYPGDIVFGMDYGREYAAIHERFARARLAAFMVPGNHDGYADHTMVARGSWRGHLVKVALCGRFLRVADMTGVMQAGACTIQELAQNLDYRLDYDGLQGFRHILGPDDYSFEVGDTRYIGINTYGGSVARRQALPLSLGRLGLWLGIDVGWPTGVDPNLGAPLVDNYGGFMDAASQRWLQGQVEAARVAGQHVVVFGHHDPTGLFRGSAAFQADTPFGSDPVSLAGFEVWNYDDGSWDSDPDDGAGPERPDANSATSLLAELARDEAIFFAGHTHRDDFRLLLPGESIGTQARAQGEVRIVQTTTGSVEPPDPTGYRGYRLVKVADGAVSSVDFDAFRGWASVPVGNFWVEHLQGASGLPGQVAVNGLPEPMTGRLRFVLPPSETGYRFVTANDRTLPLGDVMGTDAALVAWVPVEVPAVPNAAAQPVATDPGAFQRVGVRAEVAEGNDVPVARIAQAGKAPIAPGKTLKTRVGKTLTLSAAASEDRDGLFRAAWSWGGVEQEGEESAWDPFLKGPAEIRLRVTDPYGATGEVVQAVKVRCGFLGWACWGRNG